MPRSGGHDDCHILCKVAVRAAAFSSRLTAAIPGLRLRANQDYHRASLARSVLPSQEPEQIVYGPSSKLRMARFSVPMTEAKHGSGSARSATCGNAPGTISTFLPIHRIRRPSGSSTKTALSQMTAGAPSSRPLRPMATTTTSGSIRTIPSASSWGMTVVPVCPSTAVIHGHHFTISPQPSFIMLRPTPRYRTASTVDSRTTAPLQCQVAHGSQPSRRPTTMRSEAARVRTSPCALIIQTLSMPEATWDISRATTTTQVSCGTSRSGPSRI